MGDGFKINIKSTQPASLANPRPDDSTQRTAGEEAKPTFFKFGLLKEIPLPIPITVGVLAIVLVIFTFKMRPKTEFTENASIDTQLDTVTSRIMGYVNSVPFNEGDHINKGDTIAFLDTTDFMVEEQIKKVKSKKAMHDLNRAQDLAKESGISKSDLELAQIAYSAAEADLEATELKLAYSQIESPLDGVIARRTIQVGQFIQPGQTLFAIVPDRLRWVTASFKESQIISLHPGLSAKIYVDALPHLNLVGKVREVMPASLSKISLIPADNSTGHLSKIVQRFSVIIDIDHPPPILRPGMSASVEVKLDSR